MAMPGRWLHWRIEPATFWVRRCCWSPAAARARRSLADLRVRGFRVLRRAVYAAMPVPFLPEAARQALEGGDVTAALFFSAETARHFVLLVRRARLHEAVRTVDALAIGQPTALALKVLSWRRIRVAARPTQDAMLALLP